VNSNKNKSAYVFSFALILAAICFVALSAHAQEKVAVKDLTSELGNKYYDAVDYLLKNLWITDTIIQEKLRPDIALSAIIPSMIRYSALRDIVEASAMRTLYISSGRKYAHYSVGRFQMKPSFAELVERTYTRQKLGPYKFMISNTPKARSERARRLESIEWQVRYMVMFNKIMDKRYAHIKWKNDEDKARFYATAFDVGFNRDERTIRRMMTPRKINIRTKKVDSKYRTGDVAVWFMVNDAYKFMP